MLDQFPLPVRRDSWDQSIDQLVGVTCYHDLLFSAQDCDVQTHEVYLYGWRVVDQDFPPHPAPNLLPPAAIEAPVEPPVAPAEDTPDKVVMVIKPGRERKIPLVPGVIAVIQLAKLRADQDLLFP